MTPNVLAVGADWPLDRLVEFLTTKSISGAPVVSETNTLVGVVSLTDVARNGSLTDRETSPEVPSFYLRGLEKFVAREELKGFSVAGEARTLVRDVMTPMVFSVDEAAPVQEVAAAMITGRIHRVFVTREGRMVGIISSMDLLPLVRDM